MFTVLSDPHELVSVRLVKFAGAGAVGMGVDTFVLLLLVKFGGIPPVIAKLGAAFCAIAVTFGLNERYTYNASKTNIGAIAFRYLKSNLVRAGGVLVATGTLYVLHSVFGVWYIAANFIGIGVAFVVNYLAESFVTWRIHSD